MDKGEVGEAEEYKVKEGWDVWAGHSPRLVLSFASSVK